VGGPSDAPAHLSDSEMGKQQFISTMTVSATVARRRDLLG